MNSEQQITAQAAKDESTQSTPAVQEGNEKDKNGETSAIDANVDSAAAMGITMSVRLWAYGGEQRKLREVVWQPEGLVAQLVASLVQDSFGTVVETRKDLLTLSFAQPQHALAAAKTLQQKLQAADQPPDSGRTVAAVAIYVQPPSKLSKRRRDAEIGDLRRPLRESDIPQILVTEEIYKQVKGVPGFEFNDRPSRGVGGSRSTEMMYGLLWAEGQVYTEVRQAIHEASMPHFSRYEISSELGRGTMGVVYKAHDQSIDRTVALKTISLNSSAGDLDESVERLRQEAKAAGSLDHPNIITIYDMGQEDGFFYLSMQFVEGTTLSDLMASGRLQPLATVLSYVDQICAAVGFAHQRGIVHRDLKPSNIMLTSQAVIKVLDFGIAKLGNASLTQAGMVVGTPSYMAPEQAMGRKVDQRSDIFALGALFYEFFTGKRPFIGQDVTSVLYKVVHEEPEPPAAVEPLLPLGIDAIVRRALAKAPLERFQNCEEMRQAFREQAALLAPQSAVLTPVARTVPSVRVPVPPSTTTRTKVIPQPRPRRAGWSVAFICLAIVAMAAGFWVGRARWKARIAAEQIKPPATSNGTSGAPSPGAILPEIKAPADDGKTQSASPAGDHAGTPDPSAGATSPAGSTTQPSTGIAADGKPPVGVQTNPSTQPGTTSATGTATTQGDSSTDTSAASDPAKTQPGQEDPNPPIARGSRPGTKSKNGKSGSSGNASGYSKSDIPGLLRKADAAAGRAEYAFARYAYGEILRIDPRNPGALDGLRRVTAAEKAK
ncbi:MAG TPA: protein kinase [Candidatus Saccharimonadales bacterium]|jgi:serine/threonine protein kinase|nr:protein kinase [Candidatus Saccharimonadales bacterium]